jgi:hypothetical protein
MATKVNKLGTTFRYSDTVSSVNRVVIRNYLKSDPKRREMLRLHNPDIDFDKVEQEELDGVQV